MFDNMDIENLIIGGLLGDSSIEFRSDSDNISCISFCHSRDNIDYLIFKRNIKMKKYKVSKISNYSKNMSRFRLYMNDINNEMIKKYNSILRDSNRKRIIPKDISLINEEVLLIWFLDDGYITNRSILNKSKKSYYIRSEIGIGVKSYSDNDILRVSKHLKNNFGINNVFKKENGEIRNILITRKEDKYKFLDIIYKFKDIIPKSLLYKLCLCDKNNENYNLCNIKNTGICTCRDKNFNIV